MITATVTVVFEATDEADAERIVEGWSLHEGSNVTLNLNTTRMAVADDTGHVELELPAPPPPMPMMFPPPPPAKSDVSYVDEAREHELSPPVDPYNVEE